MIENLGGRKMIVALLSIIVGMAVVLIKGDISATMAGFLVGIAGLFNAGNVAATKAYSASVVAEEPPAPAVDISQDLRVISNQIGEVQSAVSEVAQATALNQQGVAAILQIAQGQRPRQ